jgi:Ca2+-binding EF-hand superfamily protein
MKKILAVAAAFVICVPFMTAGTGAQEKKGKTPEEQFKALDTNNDGKLSKEEYVARITDTEKKAKAETRFGRIDRNSDGFLSLEEYKEGQMKKKN